ncbi:MAG: hypothetical protein C4527_06705 [Candidatus Omnitrophota bacterium]|jgi:cephalosporin-C deacetylase-like acetyl esterase|nr:MAG: hypothetical protein C4527_06705 [Candidatus Omnitrophota bacterium]
MNEIHTNRINRREIFQIGGFGVLGLMLSNFWEMEAVKTAAAASDDAYTPLNRFPRMVQEYFVDRVRQAERESLKSKRSLQTKEDAEAYVQSVQAKIRESFGPFPPKTPLNARVMNVVERDTYNIENIIFESRPGFLVTANLYIPKGRKLPLPGVVGTCGHSANGKASEAYQAFSQGLARQGYVVLIYDPLGQGERLQYVDDQLKSRIGVGVLEHLHAGNQQFLTGDFIGAWRAWDGIRALDYLLTREEVDPNMVGVTGNSGGGTMTTWLCGVEQRWAMAAPSCFVITFRRNMENELPADTEQCPPKALALGLDHDDFIAAMAPQPVILLGKERDYFDARGLEEAHRRLKRLYTLLGAEDQIGLFIGPTYHGYTQENREAMYRWFNAVTKISDVASEPELVIEKDETLWCTPKGQVSEMNSRTVFSFTQEKSKELAANRAKLNEEDLKAAVRSMLKLPQQRGTPEYRILRPHSSRGYPKPRVAAYAVETEPRVHALVYRLSDEPLYSRPPRGQARAILYVSHLSGDMELREEGLIRDLLAAEPESAFFTCDVRGIGESLPNTCGQDFANPYGPDYFYAIHAIMLDYPYVGQKTFDVLRVLDWLKSCGHSEIHIAAKGFGAIPAAFASLLCDQVVQITLKNAMSSYAEIAQTEYYDWPLSALLPNVLERFDLPDCYQALEGKKLTMIEPWGAKRTSDNK